MLTATTALKDLRVLTVPTALKVPLARLARPVQLVPTARREPKAPLVRLVLTGTTATLALTARMVPPDRKALPGPGVLKDRIS